MITRPEADQKRDETFNALHKLLGGLTEHIGTTRCEHCRSLLEQILKEK